MAACILHLISPAYLFTVNIIVKFLLLIIILSKSESPLNAKPVECKISNENYIKCQKFVDCFDINKSFNTKKLRMCGIQSSFVKNNSENFEFRKTLIETISDYGQTCMKNMIPGKNSNHCTFIITEINKYNKLTTYIIFGNEYTTPKDFEFTNLLIVEKTIFFDKSNQLFCIDSSTYSSTYFCMKNNPLNYRNLDTWLIESNGVTNSFP